MSFFVFATVFLCSVRRLVSKIGSMPMNKSPLISLIVLKQIGTELFDDWNGLFPTRLIIREKEGGKNTNTATGRKAGMLSIAKQEAELISLE